MAYTDWQKLQNRARMLLQDATEEILAPFVSAAESWVDNQLRVAYKLPLTVVDNIIIEIATAEGASLAIADQFADRQQDVVTLAQDLHRWAQESLTFAIQNRTLTAEQLPRPGAIARPPAATTTPGRSPIQAALGDAFRYNGR